MVSRLFGKENKQGGRGRNPTFTEYQVDTLLSNVFSKLRGNQKCAQKTGTNGVSRFSAQVKD